MKTRDQFKAAARRMALGAAVAVLLTGCASSSPREQESAAARDEIEFATAVNRAPTAKTMYAMARILAAQQRDADCRTILTTIIREHPDFLPAYNELAELQLRERRVDEAIATLQAGLRLAPRQAVMINNLGMCSLLKGEYEEALALFTQATVAGPDDARYRANMAAALGMLGRYDESLALYQQIMMPADAHFNLAVLCESRRDTARAEAEYSQARIINAQAEATTKERYRKAHAAE